MNIIMDYDKMKIDELKSLCKNNNIRGYSGKSKEKIIELLRSPIQTETSITKSNMVDNYTPDVLQGLYQRYKDNYEYISKLKVEKIFP